MTKPLAGAFPVLPTLFRDDGQIDIADFLAVIDFALASNVDGVVYPGVASEVDTLTPEERRSQVKLLAERIDGRVPIIIGASDPDPKVAASHIAQGAEIGAAAAMVIAPFPSATTLRRRPPISRPSRRGAGVPIMLQNQPKPIGAGLTPEEIAAVAAAVPEIHYVKEETAPCGQHLTQIQAATNGSIKAILAEPAGATLPMNWRAARPGPCPPPNSPISMPRWCMPGRRATLQPPADSTMSPCRCSISRPSSACT